MTIWPLIITKALENLQALLHSRDVLYNCPGHEGVRIRKDKLANIQSGVSVLIRSVCFQHKGLFCLMGQSWATPLTVAEFARLARFSERTAARVIAYLVSMGWAKSRQIRRKNYKTGQIEVSTGLRRFTEKFWKDLGLWEMFKSSCEWAKINAKRAFLLPFKAIKLKTKKIAESVANLVKPALESLESKRIKKECNKILTMLRQYK